MANEAVPAGRLHKKGFTLLELLVVIAIMGTLASLAIPVYAKYIDKAKVTICINDIRNIQQEIDFFRDEHGGLPDCLDELPSGNRLDPWGNPYQYLNTLKATEKNKGGGGESKKSEESASECSSNLGGGGIEKVRKDRFMTPLNNDYDLYSKGADGKTNAPLTAKVSRDDIIRAGYGAYTGVAANF